MMRFSFLFFFLLSLLPVTVQASASAGFSAPVFLYDQPGRNKLEADKAFGLADTTGLDARSALELYRKGAFRAVFAPNDFGNASMKGVVYWMVLEVQNISDRYEWYLEVQDPHMGSVTVFEAERGNLIQTGTSGYYIPFSQRMTDHKNHFFSFTIVPGQHKTLLLKLYSPTYAKFYVSLVSSNHLISYSLREYWLLGIYYGGLLILFIYNLILFFNTWQKSFFWYSLFVASCILGALREDGLGFQYLWPSFPAFNFLHFDFSTLFTLFSFAGFASSFLEFRTRTPFYYYFITGLLLLYTLFHLAESYFRSTWELSSYLHPVPFVVIYLIAIRFMLKKDKSALHFVVGFSTFVLGVVTFLLRVRGFIPNNVFTIYAFNFSVLSEVLIMAYATAGKYRKQQQELRLVREQEVKLLREKAELDQKLIVQLAEQDRLKESINRELEQKVTERTNELHQKNEELAEVCRQLQFYKDRLENDWARLDKEKWELSQQAREYLFDNIKGREVTLETFNRIFPENEACMQYLADLKWSGGFTCRQCGNTRFIKGDIPFSRKCTRCTQRETVTASTLFHGIKIDLTKAFYITHVTLSGNGRITLKELSEQLQLRTATCWNFRKKVEEAKAGSPGGNWEQIILRD